MWFSRLRSAMRRVLASGRAERDLHDEIRAYADQLADEHLAAGMSHGEARRQALIELGGIESVRESVRGIRTGVHVEQWWQDLRYALRGLRRTPAFTITVVLTLGLGIGVNTAVFTVINAALLTPLPYERAEELVDLGHRMRVGTPMETTAFGLSWPEIHLWRAESQLFQGVEATRPSVQVTWRERNELLSVARFTAGLPALLGISPQAGRVFTPEEAAQRVPVLVLSDGFWARAFGRSPGAIGSTMTIAGTAMTIVGVMPAEFRYGPGGGGRTDAWTSLAEGRDPAVPGSGIAGPVFRLRTGVTVDAALPIATGAAQRIQEARPEPEPWVPKLSPLGDARSRVRSSLQTPLVLLLTSAGLVLLVACANIANLLSARSAGRRHELAMRAALGASRARLARLLVVEGAALAMLGGATALLFAKLTTDSLILLMPARMMMGSGLFSVGLPEIDWRALTFALLVTVLVALLSALWPAMRGSRVGLLSALGEGNRVAGLPVERRRTSAFLQAVQVALALVLATVAGLFAASLSKIVTADLGFDAKGLVNLTAQLPEARYRAPEAQRLAFDQALERVRATAGVRRAAIGNPPPATSTGRFIRPGAKESTARLAIRSAGAGYFSAAGIRLVAGREFGPEDAPDTTPVAIIDEVGARTLFPGESPLGQRFSYAPFAPEMTIVGVVNVVADASFATRSDGVGMYFAREQQPSRYGTFIVRADGDEATVLRNVQAGLVAFEPDIKITDSGPATDYYAHMDTYATPQFYLALVALFASMAVVTAAVGLYGLLAYSVGQRQREIGVRVALGSSAAQIRALVLTEALRPVLVGLVAGWGAAWLATGVLNSFLYQVSPRDPVTFAGSAAVLLAAALLATIGPVRRATGVDPIQALRAE